MLGPPAVLTARSRDSRDGPCRPAGCWLRQQILPPRGAGEGARGAAAASWNLPALLGISTASICGGRRRSCARWLRSRAIGPPRHSRRGLTRLRAGLGVDYAIIRFQVPGFEDLSYLPRWIAVGGLILLLANRFIAPAELTGADGRVFAEVLSVILAAGCWTLPWASARLDEAARRQVSARSASRPAECLPTLAIDPALALDARLDVSWTTSALLRLSNADGLAVWRDGKVLCTRGLLRQLPSFADGAAGILSGVAAAWQPPTEVDGFCATRSCLENFPKGLLPLSVLPGDTEAAVAKPLPQGGMLLLWSSMPRAFDRAVDRRWIAQVGIKLGLALPSSADGKAASEITEELCFESEGALGLAGDSTEESAGRESRDPFARYMEQIRLLPVILGSAGLYLLVSNRGAVLGLAETQIRGLDVAQTRVDLIGGVMAATILAQGLYWLSDTPKDPEIQDTSEWEDAEDIVRVNDPGISEAAAGELVWTWETLSRCTRICSMAVLWKESCVMQGGFFRRAAAGGSKPVAGPFCEEVVRTGRGRYLAQLKNYPAKEQFYPFLPQETQGLLLTPLRPGANAPAEGVLVLGVDAVRGVGKVDQAWVGALAEKLAVSLATT